MFENETEGTTTPANDNAGLYDNPDSMFTEDDFELPEELVFIANEPVMATVLEAKEFTETRSILLSLQIESGEHAGKMFDLWMRAPKARDGKVNANAKRRWVQFSTAFFSKDLLISGDADWSGLATCKIKFVPSPKRDWFTQAGEARVSQDFGKFEKLSSAEQTVTLSEADIPF